MTKTFRVAIVGCGSIAALHAVCLRRLEAVEVVATVDIKPERAEEMAKQFSAKAYTDYGEMLTEEKPDVVHLCTPHYLHAQMSLEAAELGVAVFTEKPPAMNRSQWKLLEAASGLVPLGVCFQNRYNGNVTQALGRLRAGDFGSVRGARAQVYWFRDEAYYADEWHGTWALEGGGVLINQAIHTLDLMNMMIDREVSAVHASMHNHTLEHCIEVEDTLEAYIRYGEVRALFFATNAYSTNAPISLELDCTEARVVLDGDDLNIYWNDGDIERIDCKLPADSEFKSYWGQGHATCIEEFYKALDEDRPAPIGVPEVRSTMGLVFAIYESCGRPALAERL